LIGYFRGGRVEVLAHREVRNILGSPYEFEADPAEVVRVYNEVGVKGLEVVGIYHTHINHPPIPSAKDVKGMELWPIPWLIVSIPSGDYSLWTLCRGKLVPLKTSLIP